MMVFPQKAQAAAAKQLWDQRWIDCDPDFAAQPIFGGLQPCMGKPEISERVDGTNSRLARACQAARRNRSHSERGFAGAYLVGRRHAPVDSGTQTSKESVDAIATDFVTTHRSSSIIRRAATVDEVASMILYVSSSQASATTGAALRVDGGVVDSIY